MTSLQQTQNLNPFVKLIRGEYGLAMTFWGAFFITGTLMNFALKMVSSEGWVVILNIFIALYLLVASSAVWNAAKRYTGNEHWTFLARTFAVMGIVSSLLRVLAMSYYGVMELILV